VLFAAPLGSPALLQIGAVAIGFSGGLFSVGTLIATMSLASAGTSGIALGSWGAVQASAAGLAIGLGGILRDVVSDFAASDGLGSVMASRGTGYATVYLIEIVLLLVTLVVIGPLVGRDRSTALDQSSARFGLSEFPT
jgi:BCD family chlorophyll transporter-like MFS transporter